MALTLDTEGPAAPPRLNGELVFAAPWEGRTFAMAMALVEGGQFSWDDFRDRLIDAVQRWESDPVGEYRYYERWQEALESIVSELDIVAGPDVDELAAAWTLTPTASPPKSRSTTPPSRPTSPTTRRSRTDAAPWA